MGTLANHEPLFITPISLLDLGPASWAYNLILIVMALLIALCFLRWQRSLAPYRALGGTMGMAGVLFLLLIGLPFPSSPWHDPVATVAMGLVTIHTVLAAWYFRHPLLVPAALLAAAALLLVLTARLPLVGAGEHILLLAAAPAMVLCYGADRLPRPRVDSELGSEVRELPLPLATLLEKRAWLSGCLWMACVVTSARAFDVLEPGPKAVMTLAAPCWLGGALAAQCAWRFPHGFAFRMTGAVVGLAATLWTGGIHWPVRGALLFAFLLPLTGGAHWLRQGMADLDR